eukprot:3737162-Rhodomonas_salina.1
MPLRNPRSAKSTTDPRFCARCCVSRASTCEQQLSRARAREGVEDTDLSCGQAHLLVAFLACAPQPSSMSARRCGDCTSSERKETARSVRSARRRRGHAHATSKSCTTTCKTGRLASDLWRCATP